MRRSIAALALFGRVSLEGERRWLTQWNVHWQALSLVGGHLQVSESFLDCCIREIAEELGLVAERDYRIDPEPIRLEYIAESLSTGEVTQYDMALFEINHLNEDSMANIDANPDNAWISEREIRSKRADNGRIVSDTVERLLLMANLLQRNSAGGADEVPERRAPDLST
jgi:ADP-ribose pyrophosphatase YjhB (NUDIX family)